jgi:hypothetical protein
VTELRSYRRVFDLERRIYSVDHLRLNPAGIPVRGVVYFIALVAASLIAGNLPGAHVLLAHVPWFMRDIVAPGVGAAVLGALRVEGRSFHLAAQALIRFWAGPRRLAGARRCEDFGERWYPSQVVFVPDGSDHRLRRLRYTGPGTVLVSIEHERRGRATERDGSATARPGLRAELELVAHDGARVLEDASVIALGCNARMLVRPSGRGRS